MIDHSFDPLVMDARAFLGDLASNNTRDWFNAHKKTYDGRLKRPALLLLDVLSGSLRDLTGTPIKTKLFRPNRDVRFSKDKTPYNTHLHMLWSMPYGPGFFFGIGLDYLRVGAGLMAFDGPRQAEWRDANDRSDEFERLIKDFIKSGYITDPPELKRIPTQYSKDHPRGDLLRRKSCVIWRDLDADGIVDQLNRHFSALTPLNKALSAL